MIVNTGATYEGHDYTIREQNVECDGLINISITNKHKKVIGRAILTMHVQKINGSEFGGVYYVLADIIVYDKEDREKGVGSHLMIFLTNEFSPIITSAHQSSKEGFDLCMKFGFKFVKAKVKGGMDTLVYEKKEVDDAEFTCGGDSEESPEKDGG